MRFVLFWVSLLLFVPSLARADERSHAYVSVSGFAGAREHGGMFTVGFPFDRTSKQLGEGQRPPPVVLTTELAKNTVLAAWRASGLGIDDGRIDDIVSRAHWSAVLPEMRLRAIRWDNERLYAYGTDDRTSDQTGANVGLEARLTWRLDRLVYVDDELGLERIRLERQETRSRIAQRALEALFHWQRSQMELKTAIPATLEEAEAASKVAEAEAALDVLTAGWFSQRAARRPAKP